MKGARKVFGFEFHSSSGAREGLLCKTVLGSILGLISLSAAANCQVWQETDSCSVVITEAVNSFGLRNQNILSPFIPDFRPLIGQDQYGSRGGQTLYGTFDWPNWVSGQSRNLKSYGSEHARSEISEDLIAGIVRVPAAFSSAAGDIRVGSLKISANTRGNYESYGLASASAFMSEAMTFTRELIRAPGLDGAQPTALSPAHVTFSLRVSGGVFENPDKNYPSTVHAFLAVTSRTPSDTKSSFDEYTFDGSKSAVFSHTLSVGFDFIDVAEIQISAGLGSSVFFDGGRFDFGHSAYLSLNSPDSLQYSSSSGVFLSQAVPELSSAVLLISGLVLGFPILLGASRNSPTSRP